MKPALDPCDVVVIGGGIAGIMTAFYLNEAGLKVTLVEKGRIACEQSSRNWGWVRKQGRDSRELPLAIKALELWQGLSAKIGDDLGWYQGGVTYLAANADAMREFERWADIAKLYQLDTRLLTKADVLGQIEVDASKVAGGIVTPSDGRAEPSIAVPKIAQYLRQNGVQIFENTAARLIDTAQGNVRGLITENGRIACSSIVVAAGAWSSLFLRRHGFRLPQLKVKASVLRTSKLPLISQSALGHGDAAIRRRADGGYTVARSSYSTFNIVPDAFRYLRDFKPVLKNRLHMTKIRLNQSFMQELRFAANWDADDQTPFEQHRVLDPTPDNRLLDEVWHAAQDLYPQLKAGQVVERWAGMIDVTPDEIPALGPVPAMAGLYVATGFSGHGFGIGPGAGYCLAQTILGKTPDCDLHPLRPARFAEPGGVTQGDAL